MADKHIGEYWLVKQPCKPQDGQPMYHQPTGKELACLLPLFYTQGDALSAAGGNRDLIERVKMEEQL